MSASARALSWSYGRDFERDRDRTQERAFERLYREHRMLVAGVVRRYLWGAAVDDVIQETFAQAYRSGLHLLDGDDTERTVRGRLATIARNRSIDVLRRRMRGIEEVPDDGRLTETMGTAADGAPEDRFLAARRRVGITEALDSLCERQRRVMVLRYVDGRSYEEIAAAEGISVSAVKATLVRGRQTFRHLYASIAEREGLTVIFGHQVLARLLARLRSRVRWTRERVVSGGSNALGSFATASPGLAQIVAATVVAGAVAMIGAAGAAAEEAPANGEREGAACAEADERSEPCDADEPREGESSRGHPDANTENGTTDESGTEASGPDRSISSSSAHNTTVEGDDEGEPTGVSHETSASVDSDDVSPVEDGPDASATASADAEADPNDRRAGSDQSAQGKTASPISETSNALTNDVETVRGNTANSQTARTGTENANEVTAGCIDSTEHPMPAAADPCAALP